MEEINQDDHEKIRHDIDVQPEDQDPGLTVAEEIQWFLTDDPQQGEGQALITKSDSDAALTVVDDSTFDVELNPEDTRDLPIQDLYAECTIVWSGDPSTVDLEPKLRVRETLYDSTT